MWAVWVEATEVTIHGFSTYSAYIFELHGITTKVCHIHDEVVFCLVYKFSHKDTIPHGFLKCCLSQILRNAPLPPIEN